VLFLVDCVGHYINYLTEFFILCVNSRSHAKLATPIGTFVDLHSHTNLPHLVNLALKVVQGVS